MYYVLFPDRGAGKVQIQRKKKEMEKVALYDWFKFVYVYVYALKNCSVSLKSVKILNVNLKF